MSSLVRAARSDIGWRLSSEGRPFSFFAQNETFIYSGCILLFGDGVTTTKDLRTAEVLERPKCDFCGKPAEVDGRTRMGPWAFMCEGCYPKFGVGLGLGRGQLLIVKGE